jgi:hypothetical protein
VYGAVPPVTIVLTAPLQLLAQLAFVAVVVTVNPEFDDMDACALAVQPVASVTVNVYVPAAIFVKPLDVALLFHKYV